MIILLSPAKSQDFSEENLKIDPTNLLFKKKTLEVLSELKKFNTNELEKLLGVSSKIAKLNFERFEKFNSKFTTKNSKPAVFAYTGDVYQGLDVRNLNKTQINFLQKHLKIITGFYGVLRPLDSIQPYRLEMKNKLSVNDNKNLYSLWTQDLTKYLIDEIKNNKSEIIVNLASMEYSKAVDFKKLNAKLITPVFKDKSKGVYKVIAIYAKKARGMMVNYIAQNKIKSEQDLRGFDYEGYKFSKSESRDGELVFLRA
ncbi:UNVERIFIED_CONTAM: hypothetical protein GTU68_062590 [Idotea baltica]|nr:hypothetical protein [Idotea baltica]